jgi:anti-sigma B factor antagonist
MHIKAEPRENYTVLHLRGEFDTFYCPLLQTEIDSLTAAGVSNIVLNLRLVKFINSTAMGAIIKASKSLKKEGGKLTISRPSAFCREALGKVGLERVVPILDSDETAGASMLGESAPKAASEDDMLREDETIIIFSPVDEERAAHFVSRDEEVTNPVHGHTFGSSWRGVGRMAGLDAEGVRFTWNGGQTGLTSFEMAQLLALGTAIKTKFRLPLLKKGLLEAVLTITSIEERPDGVKIGASFSEIDDATRDSVQQYAEDLRFLRQELDVTKE